ncbi:hypothetical protein SAMN02745132_04655 [Enterovibrio nigricans DSM 22720]|uniref:Uncharacterized protein n=2 Tax=Enterovibrio nigricans TaxID=504469 RepID=A0A1T4W1B1_9GAMM|nr:hypothetical protein SAMN02745132_04655 [Enterovibrio nigricans DSM 22720]
MPFDFKVYIRNSSGLVDIICPKEGKIASVTPCGIELDGVNVEQVTDGSFGLYGWALSSPQNYILSVRTTSWFNGKPCFKYGDRVVATISNGGGIVEMILSLLKTRRWNYENAYTKIDFNECYLDRRFALCLLLQYSCKPFSPSS